VQTLTLSKTKDYEVNPSTRISALIEESCSAGRGMSVSDWRAGLSFTPRPICLSDTAFSLIYCCLKVHF